MDFANVRTSLVYTRNALEEYDKKMGTVSAKHYDLKALNTTPQELIADR
jgi:hypothetical protein